MELDNITKIHSSEKSEIILGESAGKQYIKKTGEISHDAVQKIARINSPYIAKICEFGENYIITEYAEGFNLSERKIPVKKVFEVALELCDALSVLHEQDIIHRDVKPSNIILCNDGHIKLIDFDAARIKKTTTDKDTRFVGTDGFAPPEQYGFMQTDERSDIYSFGVTLKLLLRENYAKSLYKHVIEKCIRFNPEQRYGSIKAVRAALKRSRYIPVTAAVSGICAVICVALIAIISARSAPKVPVISSVPNSSEAVSSDVSDSFSSSSDMSSIAAYSSPGSSSNVISSTNPFSSTSTSSSSSTNTSSSTSTSTSLSTTSNTASLSSSTASTPSSSTITSITASGNSNDFVPPEEDEFDPDGYRFRWELLTMPNDFPVFMRTVSEFTSLCLSEHGCVNYVFYWNYLPETEARNFVQIFKDKFGGEEEFESNWISKIWHVYGDVVSARVTYVTSDEAAEPKNSCYLTISDFRNGAVTPKLNCDFGGDTAIPEFSERTIAWADSPMNGVIPELSEYVSSAMLQRTTFNFHWDYMMIGEVGTVLEKINEWLGDCDCTMETEYFGRLIWRFYGSANGNDYYVRVTCDQELHYPGLTRPYVEVQLLNKNSED